MKTIPEQITARYIERTPKSQAMTERAHRVLPGGDTRTGVYFAPYPAFMVQGSGSYLTDLDGNRYLDFLNNYTSLVHGHAHPALIQAAREQLPNGSVYASPMVKQVELAELICDRVPSVEMLRFCNSGTEATMLAVRAARGFTGRSGILKMRGAYHGSHDLAAATADPEADRGIPDGLRQNIFMRRSMTSPRWKRYCLPMRPRLQASFWNLYPMRAGFPCRRQAICKACARWQTATMSF